VEASINNMFLRAGKVHFWNFTFGRTEESYKGKNKKRYF
jgi:hypothetical protein